MQSILNVSVFRNCNLVVRMCVTVVCSETENLKFCSIKVYIRATNALLAEKILRFGEIYTT